MPGSSPSGNVVSGMNRKGADTRDGSELQVPTMALVGGYREDHVLWDLLSGGYVSGREGRFTFLFPAQILMGIIHVSNRQVLSKTFFFRSNTHGDHSHVQSASAVQKAVAGVLVRVT